MSDDDRPVWAEVLGRDTPELEPVPLLAVPDDARFMSDLALRQQAAT